MILKASAIRNLTDARYFAAREVDYLGFCIDEGAPGYLDPMYMRAIMEWVEGPRIVGELPLSSPEVAAQAAQFYQLHAIQTPWPADRILGEGFEKITSLSADMGESEARAILDSGAALFVLYDAPKSAIDRRADFWRDVFGARRILVHYQDAPALLECWLSDYAISGLSISGGDEEQIGIKSFEELDELFDALESIAR